MTFYIGKLKMNLLEVWLFCYNDVIENKGKKIINLFKIIKKFCKKKLPWKWNMT